MRLERTGETVLEGHVFDKADLERRFVVELLLNDRPAGIARAELFDARLGATGGDGCHGFCFHLAPDLLPSLRTAAVRLANTNEPVGDRLDFGAGLPFSASSAPFGKVEWMGGLRLAGWVARTVDDFPPWIEAWANGVRVMAVRADIWRSVAHGDGETAEPGFELRLPDAFADGRAREVDVLCAGREIPGSPVRLIAFADGLEDFLLARAETSAEAARGRLFDEAFPDAVPFEMFDDWDRRFPLAAPEMLPAGPVAIAVIGEEGAEATLSGFLLDSHDGWVGAILPAANGATRFAPRDLLHFLQGEAGHCATVLFLPAGAEIRRFAPERLASALDADAGAEIAYGDFLLRGEDGTCRPLALPAFDYERVLEQGIGATAFAMRRGAAVDAAGRGIAELRRLFLAPLDRGGLQRAAHLHVPGFGFVLPAPDLADDAPAQATRDHLAARGEAAEVTLRPAATLPAVRVRRKAATRSLTLVLDAGADASRIAPALEALEATRATLPISVVIAAPVLEESVREHLRLDAIGLSETAPTVPPARRLAAAMELATGDLVCILDARLRPANADWLAEILSRAAEPDVGAVGPLILGADGTVADAGRVLRAAGPPVSPFTERRADDPGYGDALTVARQVAAIGPACLLTRRADFLALGGFDPLLFPDHYGAVDYCLKLQALGRRVVTTPDAVLAFASGTAGEAAESPPARRLRLREQRVLLARWASVLANDPFYSPLLDRGALPYSGLAWPPGDTSPRRSSIAPARAVPPGW